MMIIPTPDRNLATPVAQVLLGIVGQGNAHLVETVSSPCWGFRVPDEVAAAYHQIVARELERTAQPEPETKKPPQRRARKRAT